jgi:hypothetical protein
VFFTAQADFFASTLTCDTLPVVPLSAKMISDINGSNICSETAVNYTCNAGGINAFRVNNITIKNKVKNLYLAHQRF